MSIIRRGRCFGVKVWDADTRRYRWVGTYRTEAQALLAETSAKNGVFPVPEPSRGAGGALEGPVVYFVSAPELGLVKIGFSTDLAARFDALAHGSPVELRLLHAEPGSEERERSFHERFDLLRVRGEWFRIAGDLADYLNEAIRQPARLRAVSGGS